MNRKDFLRKMSFLSLGLTLLPDFSFGNSVKARYKVGIIGAGISGLYLADFLKSNGHDVTVLEAKNTAGGRIQENKLFFSSPIDLGAQWIHGSNNELFKVVKKSKTPVYVDKKNENIKIYYKGEYRDDFPPEFYQLIKEVENQTPLKNDQSVLEFAKKINGDIDFLGLVENLLTDTATSAAYFSLNEVSRMTKQLNPVDYQFTNGTMFSFIEKRFISNLTNNLILNCSVASIDYSGKSIKVCDSNNSIFEFDKVILTVPITILKKGNIEFIPALPSEKVEAFKLIGMDKGLKLFLKFDQRFFDHSIFNGQYAGYYIDPTKNQPSTQYLLASLVMGKKAELHYESRDKSIDNYLEDLDKIYSGKASKHFIDFLVQDWGNSSNIEGVYSYTKPGGAYARKIASQPISNKLYFAGEAMNTNKNYGTVHGAIETAIQVLSEFE